jgi:glycosyltransferase involved in cell wall biosynthesis
LLPVPGAPTSHDDSQPPRRRLNGLLWRLRATRRLWRPGARPEMPLLEPVRIEIPQAGRLDVPFGGPGVERAAVRFYGWTLFASGPAAKVELWLGGEPLGRARLGLRRADVGAALELEPGAATGFELTANLERWPGRDGATELRALATGPAGERLELEPLALEISTPRAAGIAGGPERTPASPERPGQRALIVTHQLDLGGAQLYLMDLLRELLRTESIAPTVVSARDGELRAELEALGVPVHVAGLPPTEDLSSHLGRAEELAAWIAAREFEVGFVNTATALVLPGVEALDMLGIPTIWAIHESFEPAELWNHVDPEIRHRAEAALRRVAQPLFVAAATQRLFEPATGRERGLTIPYGLDLEPIDGRRAGFDRDDARREAGLPPEAEVVLVAGAIEPRKAQVPLVGAFDQLAAAHPRAHLVFVGGREDVYTEFLGEYAAASAAAERIRIVPITPDVQPWFGLADLVVCASDVESMPRTALEAMAWETPVLATDVFGLPELIADGENGWLCEPRDVAALGAALERALASTPEERRRLGRAGRELIEERHSLAAYGREIAELLERIGDTRRGLRLVDAAAR